MSFIQYLEKRRSIYAIGRRLSQTPEQLTEKIKAAIRQSPSAFNSQSSRAVILFEQAHEQLWQIVLETLKDHVATDQFSVTADKLSSFAAGLGTVLFYEDQDTVQDLQQQYPAYADQFPIWSEQASGMAQLSVWTALAEDQIGASLQHYNPLIDQRVAEVFDIPQHWKLRAQLVFGSIEQPPKKKTFIDDAKRFKVLK